MSVLAVLLSDVGYQYAYLVRIWRTINGKGISIGRNSYL